MRATVAIAPPDPATRPGPMRAARRWLVVAALLWLLLPWPASAQTPVAIPVLDSPVVDTIGALDADARQQLVAQALALQQRKGSQLQVLLVPTTGGEDIAQYAQRVFDAWKPGRAGVDDGVLVVVATEDRRVRIHVGYGLEGVITDEAADRVIREYLLPRFRDGDHAAGLLDGSAKLVALIDGEALPEPDTAFPLGMKIVLGLFALPFIAIPIAGMVAAWRRGPKAFLGRWAVVAGLVAIVYFASIRQPVEPGSEEWWIPIALLSYLVTTFVFIGTLGTGSSRSGDRSSGGGSSSSSSSRSSSSWSGGGGRSGGGGSSGSW